MPRPSIANSDINVLVAPLPFISQQNNFDCSKLITKDQVNMRPTTGYTIQLANPFNLTDVSTLLHWHPLVFPLHSHTFSAPDVAGPATKPETDPSIPGLRRV